MKTKIYLAVLAMAFFACSGEKKSTQELPEVDELVETATEDMDSTAAEIDTLGAEVDSTMTSETDSVAAEIDSVTSEAP